MDLQGTMGLMQVKGRQRATLMDRERGRERETIASDRAVPLQKTSVRNSVTYILGTVISKTLR